MYIHILAGFSYSSHAYVICRWSLCLLYGCANKKQWSEIIHFIIAVLL